MENEVVNEAMENEEVLNEVEKGVTKSKINAKQLLGVGVVGVIAVGVGLLIKKHRDNKKADETVVDNADYQEDEYFDEIAEEDSEE